ncbi:hypothetical protein ACFQX6_48075 [Streptosporangium lutulentum]
MLDDARRRGLVRADLLVRDLAAIVVMVLATVHRADLDGADQRRYLALLLDGIRPSAEPLPAPSATRLFREDDGRPAPGAGEGARG